MRYRCYGRISRGNRFQPPGGNVIGISTSENRFAEKCAELLKEVAPELAGVGVIYSPEAPQSILRLREAVAPALKVGTTSIPVISQSFPYRPHKGHLSRVLSLLDRNVDVAIFEDECAHDVGVSLLDLHHDETAT